MDVILRALLALILVTGTWTEDCKSLGCGICCSRGSDGKYLCHDDELICLLEQNTDFNLLKNCVTVLTTFLLGIPILLLLINVLVLKRIKIFRLSFCELLFNTVCLLSCIKKHKKTVKKQKSEMGKINIEKQETNFSWKEIEDSIRIE